MKEHIEKITKDIRNRIRETKLLFDGFKEVNDEMKRVAKIDSALRMLADAKVLKRIDIDNLDALQYWSEQEGIDDMLYIELSFVNKLIEDKYIEV